MRLFLSLLLLSALPALAQPALAQSGAEAPPRDCKVLESTGDRFCKYGNRWRLENARPAAFAPGDAFPVYEQSMLMDLRPYRLPPVDGPWRYYLHEGILYKVSAATGRVIEVLGRARRH